MRDSEHHENDTSSGEEDCFGDVGFMFDNALPKTRRLFRFGDVSVAVRLVDDDPGAVQSGHYVWPAAPALSAYLVDRRLALPRGGRCLELGAGCGLAGLVAAQLVSTKAVVFTDHDPGVLDNLLESIAEQEQDPELGGSQAAAKCRCVPLSWGAVGKTERGLLADALSSASASSASLARQSDNSPADDGGLRDTSARSGAGENGVTTATAAAVGGAPPEESGPKQVWPCGTAVEGVGLQQDDGASSRCNSGRGDGDGDGGGGGDVPAAAATAVAFDLVIASDVIYSVSVVRPLFQTVTDLLLRRNGGCPPGAERTPPPNPAAATSASPAKERKGEAEDSRAATAAAEGGHEHDEATSGEENATKPPPPQPPQPPPPPLQGRGMSDQGAGGGADGSPMFLMSQSFGYDAETERDIDRACQELGLAREVVWDELPVATATATRGGWGQQPPPPPPQGGGGGDVEAEATHPLASLDGGSSGGGRSGSCGGGGGGGGGPPQLPLSRQLRAGTKLQRFWRL